jgi:hypothetical protein
MTIAVRMGNLLVARPDRVGTVGIRPVAGPIGKVDRGRRVSSSTNPAQIPVRVRKYAAGMHGPAQVSSRRGKKNRSPRRPARPKADPVRIRTALSVRGRTGRNPPMTPEVNVLALVKGRERFVYVYDDASHPDLIAALRDHAADPELSLSWFDATVLTTKAREQVRANQPEPAVGPPLGQVSGFRDQESEDDILSPDP